MRRLLRWLLAIDELERERAEVLKRSMPERIYVVMYRGTPFRAFRDKDAADGYKHFLDASGTGTASYFTVHLT